MTNIDQNQNSKEQYKTEAEKTRTCTRLEVGSGALEQIKWLENIVKQNLKNQNVQKLKKNR